MGDTVGPSGGGPKEQEGSKVGKKSGPAKGSISSTIGGLFGGATESGPVNRTKIGRARSAEPIFGQLIGLQRTAEEIARQTGRTIGPQGQVIQGARQGSGPVNQSNTFQSGSTIENSPLGRAFGALGGQRGAVRGLATLGASAAFPLGAPFFAAVAAGDAIAQRVGNLFKSTDPEGTATTETAPSGARTISNTDFSRMATNAFRQLQPAGTGVGIPAPQRQGPLAAQAFGLGAPQQPPAPQRIDTLKEATTQSLQGALGDIAALDATPAEKTELRNMILNELGNRATPF